MEDDGMDGRVIHTNTFFQNTADHIPCKTIQKPYIKYYVVGFSLTWDET